MKASCASDIGRKRKVNEDRCFFDANRGLFIVADGVGGHRAGETASEIAVKTVSTSLFPAGGAADYERTGGSVSDAIRRSIGEANEAIYTAASRNPELRGMGTTIVVALRSDSELCIAHVGDSRAYLIRDDLIKQLTEDHSFVAELVRLGRITPEEARRHHLRHVITRCLGTEPQVDVDIQEIRLLSGDYVVLCTDGLSDLVSDGVIKDVVLDAGEPTKACRRLVHLANELGGTDNITVIVVHLDM